MRWKETDAVMSGEFVNAALLLRLSGFALSLVCSQSDGVTAMG